MDRPFAVTWAMLGALAAFLTLAPVGRAHAAEVRPYDAASFKGAQASGAPILVEVTAPWCPTCRAQKPILAALAAQPENTSLFIFAVDFDTQKAVVRELGAQSQSTLVAFQGKTETGRSVGDTNPASIAALVRSAVGK
ncbi:thioredoxin family protein [Aquabacter spiritensis]|uniref:Thiol-disulfide isomerase/thioredoxin n=1 Tax=Aquabacter spiritensis TaxID=933073 RepID=A0A4R3M4B7_9HYPH|nr:thioredoxin family protein [Aquabacter spiritensis]TCT07676.1 thiol-disulfide isomerase/thioredoxin [Aquabacter spiritensis]